MSINFHDLTHDVTKLDARLLDLEPESRSASHIYFMQSGDVISCNISAFPFKYFFSNYIFCLQGTNGPQYYKTQLNIKDKLQL